MTTPACGFIPGTAPVSFSLTPAKHGWIQLEVAAAGQSVKISCSDVYDPFEDIIRWLEDAMNGRAGSCEIDQEGHVAILALHMEPGALKARFRAYEPGIFGEIVDEQIDASVDLLQMVQAWYTLFSAYVRSYDPEHWEPNPGPDDKPAERTLALLRLGALENHLILYGLLADPDGGQAINDDWFARMGATARTRHALQCEAARPAA